MNTKLKSRLDRLEAKRKPDPLRIFIVRAGQSEDAITGFYIAGDTATLRKPGESLTELQARATAAVTDGRLVAIFRPLH